MVNARAGYGRRDARGRVGKRRRDGIRRWRERDKMATRFRGRLDGQGARFETHRCTKRRKNSGILSYFTSPRIARLVGAIYSMDKQDGDFRNAFVSIFNEIRFGP